MIFEKQVYFCEHASTLRLLPDDYNKMWQTKT